MTDDLWSKPDGGRTYNGAASPSPLSEIPSPQGGPTLPWYRSRIREEDSERARRDARFVTIGALGGLALGALTATVLAITVPEVMGRPWIEMLVVLTGVIAGILIGLMPGLRFHAGKLK
jgi:ABC-type spermidine/putrescine transport system permease subunit II